jgi:lysophospholipase L1-like esterase
VVDAYNAAIARVAAATGAVLVDLHGAGLTARQSGTEASLVSSDGFHPSDAGHALVAKAFAAAYAAR